MKETQPGSTPNAHRFDADWHKVGRLAWRE